MGFKCILCHKDFKNNKDELNKHLKEAHRSVGSDIAGVLDKITKDTRKKGGKGKLMVNENEEAPLVAAIKDEKAAQKAYRLAQQRLGYGSVNERAWRIGDLLKASKAYEEAKERVDALLRESGEVQSRSVLRRRAILRGDPPPVFDKVDKK
jgi:hypothetical protein